MEKERKPICSLSKMIQKKRFPVTSAIRTFGNYGEQIMLELENCIAYLPKRFNNRLSDEDISNLHKCCFEVVGPFGYSSFQVDFHLKPEFEEEQVEEQGVQPQQQQQPLNLDEEASTSAHAQQIQQQQQQSSQLYTTKGYITPNSTREICKIVKIDTNCASVPAGLDHVGNHLDLATTLRSELAAISCKRDRLVIELAESKSALVSKESECESLRAQAARQSALIGSLQSRLQTAENREHSIQSRCDSTISTIQREKRCVDEKSKELICKINELESRLTQEETQKEHAKDHLQELIRKLSACFLMDICDAQHLSPDCIINRAEEIMAELHRTKSKIASTCDTLSSCESELLNLKTIANSDKQRLTAQLEVSHNHHHELENRLRQLERDLQIARDRLTESEITGEKMREELRGFESRCHRFQSNMDRSQTDRMQFLRSLASLLNIPEPCETLIKEKIREILNENQTQHTQLHSLRDQLNSESCKLKEIQETSQCRLRNEETMKAEIEERLERTLAELHDIRQEHMGLSEFLVRLARAISWSECTSPPAPGTDTNIMAESLLEKAERMAAHHDHHSHSPEKVCCDHGSHHHSHAHIHGKLRREKSCHDISIKESSSMYQLQRRVRVLREQVQRRDLHLELLKRKLAIIEDGARGKCILQGERDDAVCRAKKASKQVDKLTAQLVDAKSQIAEARAQLAEAVEYKITALERARKIDELTGQICDLEEEKTRLTAQLSALKERMKTCAESSQNRRCRDEALINSLRDDISQMQGQLSDANHRLSHLQSFRTSVARTLHLRDLPETDLLHRLQTLCSAHQEFTLLSRRFESASPVGDHPCPRYDDAIPPTTHCRPLRSSSPGPPCVTSTTATRHERSSSTLQSSRHKAHYRSLSRGRLGLGLGDTIDCEEHSRGREHCHDGHHFDETYEFSKKY
ncbi:coiled-coil domain-containing protein 170 [Episyrphus balteatus]|uniref:coiled-coil domain-containing protein 170 n=1 Tax=Episyrphus balteatus TaxID=286459 RepID=UPI0024850FC3|nr:coiled-coil domain-containing protein 170 [Episyrphus balteatus]